MRSEAALLLSFALSASHLAAVLATPIYFGYANVGTTHLTYRSAEPMFRKPGDPSSSSSSEAGDDGGVRLPPPEDPFVENSGSSDSANERGKDGVVAFDGSRKKGDLVWSGTKKLSKALSPAEQKALTAKNQLVIKDHPLKKLASTELYKLGEKPKVMTTVQKDFGRGPAQHQVEISSSRKGGEKVDRLPQVNDGLKAAGFKPDGEPLIPGGKKHSHSAKCGEIECANRLVKANKNDPDVLRGAIYHSTSLVNGQPQTVRPCEGCQAFIDATGGHALRKRGPPGCKCPPGQTKAKPTKPSTTKSSSKPSNDASKKPVAEEQGPPHKPEKQVTPSSPKPEKSTKQQSPHIKPKDQVTPPSPKPKKSTNTKVGKGRRTPSD